MGQAQARAAVEPYSDLSATEKVALDAIRAIAAEGRQATIAEICEAIGSANRYGGTVPGIVKRLESKGYIERHVYQRGMMLCILTEDGEKVCTAEPKCTAPHWREVYDQSRDSTPTLPRATLNQFPHVMKVVNDLMRQRNLTFANAQVMLMSYGVSAFAAEQGA